MIEREFSLLSSDGKSILHCMEWKPEGEICAALQISHGMIDHIARYKEFAEFLTESGIVVYGHDHLGHGKTAAPEDLGFFSEKDGASCVIRDIHRVARYGAKKYPGIRHFFLGHSMGSYFLRRYLLAFHDEMDGAILVGTGDQPTALVWTGYFLAGAVCRLKGNRYRSRFLHALALGGNNRAFRPIRTRHDWLSRDEEQVNRYEQDELCRFLFTSGAYRDFFQTILGLKRMERRNKIPAALPVLFLSGDKDPVGENGKGVGRVYHRYDQAGCKDLTIGFYHSARHEILNEINREEVYGDICRWIRERIGEE